MTKMRIVNIDLPELIVRMAEASTQIDRPAGRTNAEILDDLDETIVDSIQRMAHAAVVYMVECQKEAFGAENVSDVLTTPKVSSH